MATQEIIRKMQNYGDSFFIGLPREWVKKNNLVKGDSLILQYNGVVKITPQIFDVVVEKDVVFFVWKEQKAGLNVSEVRRVMRLHGLDEALKLIKRALMERRNYPDSFPEDLMRKKLSRFEVDFAK